ncbi:multicopper oxidase domain-containing protein [Natronosalvus caseinilyticus]|uniref:multicopper oxidase domain-containing protein n=1 Tax=Natronosalvus caseinilyticus TaxID=2953747 RepID=UPI0028AA61E8|nr:multicopper oxidase domain-containing protein [Natronosalvus caseinilyticus]
MRSFHSSGKRTVSRRRVLSTAGVAGLATLAGCTSPTSSREPGEDRTESDSSSSGASSSTDNWSGADATDVETDHPYTSSPEIVDLDETDGAVTLTTEAARHQLLGDDASGGPWELPEVWAWKTADGGPSVPGPLLRVTEGTEMEITYDNTEHNRPHTFHVHALKKNWMDDGAPTTTGRQVDAGETGTYEITANVPGTHLYHCHFQTQNHLDMGMYGILRVDPVDYDPPDKEFFLTIKDWDSRLSASMAGGDVTFSHRDRNPDVFTVNGRVAPYSLHPEEGSPMIVEQGDRVRIHITNNGYQPHSMHTHNHRFEVVEKDGSVVPETARYKEDVVPISPAERKTIEFTADADPGIYAMHCHRVNHVMNGERYPGGMLTGIVYEDALETEQFAALMKSAGYEG